MSDYERDADPIYEVSDMEKDVNPVYEAENKNIREESTDPKVEATPYKKKKQVVDEDDEELIS